VYLCTLYHEDIMPNFAMGMIASVHSKGKKVELVELVEPCQSVGCAEFLQTAPLNELRVILETSKIPEITPPLKFSTIRPKSFCPP